MKSIWGLLLISLVLLLEPSCFSQQLISVPLIKVEGHFPFASSRSFGVFEPTLDLFKFDSSQFSMYGVWRFTPDKLQNAFNNYLRSGRTDSSFAAKMKSYSWDTTQLDNAVFENSINVFVGIDRQSGSFTVIPDLNNNRDFFDDTLQTFANRKPTKDSLSFYLDRVPLTKIRTLVKRSGKLHSVPLYVRFVLKQFFGNFSTHFSDRKADSLLLVIESNEHLEGKFKAQSKSFVLYLQNSFLSPIYSDPELIRFVVREESQKPAKTLLSFLTSEMSDTVSISTDLYKISSIDLLGTNAILSHVGKSKGLGIVPGFNAKSFQGQDILSTQAVSLKTFHDQYLLLDFWGTWCLPCIEILPSIKEVGLKYSSSGLKVLGIAFDKDTELVKRFLSREKVPWNNLLDQDGGNAGKTLIKDIYKVNVFPTNILIDPKGKILFRSEGSAGFQEMRSFMKQHFGY
jgi:thiol-disulfide isomerase/thioredoxin